MERHAGATSFPPCEGSREIPRDRPRWPWRSESLLCFPAPGSWRWRHGRRSGWRCGGRRRCCFGRRRGRTDGVADALDHVLQELGQLGSLLGQLVLHTLAVLSALARFRTPGRSALSMPSNWLSMADTSIFRLPSVSFSFMRALAIRGDAGHCAVIGRSKGTFLHQARR